MRRELGIPPDAFVIAVSANFIAYKGHSDLFDALGTLKGRLRGEWRLVLIGQDLGAAAALRRKAGELGIAGNIVWIEGRADAQSPLAAADIGVLPSHQEGFSNSLIEMMASGLPVIAAKIGGNIDAVVDRESGLLYAVKDVAALAVAIIALHDDPAGRQSMGAAARARRRKFFARRLRELLRRFLRASIKVCKFFRFTGAATTSIVRCFGTSAGIGTWQTKSHSSPASPARTAPISPNCCWQGL